MVDLDKMPRGIGANYDVWTPDTEITLTNVPWDNNYRDVVKFSTSAARNAYIDSLVTASTTIEGSSYARADRPINLRIPMTEAYGFNYVRVRNREQAPVGNAQMYYYYFIIGIEYINPGVTRFMLQIDIFQTFGDAVTWGQCYVERGHIGIANANAFQNYGRDYLTLEEGLDTGADQRVFHQAQTTIMTPAFCDYMVICNTSLTASPGDITNPALTGASGTNLFGSFSGANVYIFKTANDLQQFLSDYAPYPWVTQGIMGIIVIPDLANFGYELSPVTINKSSAQCFVVNTSHMHSTDANMGSKWRDTVVAKDGFPVRYRNLKKFFTYPYMSVEMTTFSGAPIVLKPEQWQNDNGDFSIMMGLLAPGQRVVIAPLAYNGDRQAGDNRITYPDGTFTRTMENGEFLDHATVVGNFPQLAIVNNSGILAIASQAHSLAQQYKSTDWSQQKALQGNQVSYDQSTAAQNNSNFQSQLGRSTNTQLNDVANSQAIMRTAVGAGSGLISGAMAGAGSGGPVAGAAGAAVGVGTGIANTALDINQRNASLAVNNSSSSQSQANNNSTASYMRDTNKSLADWTARGDYAQSIAGIQAKVQDTALTAPFTSGQAGGDTFNFLNQGITLQVRVKLLNPASMRAIGEYWLRYGYAVQQFVKLPDDLMVMSNFTYWKLSETYITAARIPEVFKQAIRGIFEKGVTVWADPTKIGNIDRADNVAKAGITL